MSKNRVIVEAVLAGQSHGAVAHQCGISTVWVGKLVARWRAGGWDALAKQSTRPKSNADAIGQEVIARVIALRHELIDAGLDAGSHTIAALLQSSGLPVPSVATIWRILTRAGLVTPETPQAPQTQLPAHRGRPAQRVLAIQLHPLAPCRRHRHRGPDLAR